MIVDDDVMCIKLIEKFVEQTNYLDLINSCESAIEAANILAEESVDLIFLDVEMPEMTGLELIKSLERIPQIILITSKTDYAVEAFEYQVTDYIVKPANYSRFMKAVSKAKEIYDSKFKGERNTNSLYVKEDSVWVNIPLDSIHWIEALGDYVTIHTEEKKHTVLTTMKEIETKLPEERFMRVHRSNIVNLNRITNLDGNLLVLEKKLIPIGKSYKKSLMNRLNLI